MLILSDLTQKFYHTILWIFLGYVMLATSKRTRPIGPILYTIMLEIFLSMGFC